MDSKIGRTEVFWVILVSLLPLMQGTIEEVIATQGGSIRFNCLSPGAVGVEWLVNGTSLENLNLNNVTAEFAEGIGGVLTLTNLPVEYNMTRITCILTGTSQVVNTTFILLLQGHLSAVGSLSVTVQDSTISLTWTAPFTQDITGVDPDITYCVGVVYSTSSSTLHSECGITETEYEYTYSIPFDIACHDYMVTVTPVNPAGNGTPSTLVYPVLEAPQLHSNGVIVSMNRILIIMSADVCSAELMLVDLYDTDVNIVILENTDLTIERNNITFSTEKLNVNRHFNVTIEASNSAGLTRSKFTISTHDVLLATTTETDDDAIVITTLYSEHSDARGALFDFVFIDDNGDVDFIRSVLLALDRNTSLHHTLPFNLYPGQYRVFVYDIESDGTLSNGVSYPAVTNEFSTSKEYQELVQPECFLYCSITVSSDLILAECSMNGALVTGFQMIAQLSDSSEVHKLHANQSMDLQTPVTVEVEESGVYQVAVFAIREGTGIVGSSYVEYTVDMTTTYESIDTTTEDTNDDAATTSAESFTEANSSEKTNFLVISLGIALGIFILMFIATCGVIIVQCYMIRSLKSKRRTNSETQIQLDVTNTEEPTVANQESQLYEEIGDMNTPTSTGNTGVSSSAPGTGTAAARAQYEYEDVKPVGSGVAKSSDPYDITLCSAYGVALNQDRK